MSEFTIREAQKEDCDLILHFIKGIADFEKLSHQVVATEALIEEHLFGPKSVAFCYLGYEGETPVGFALYFRNYSTFLSKPGIYLEDLYIDPKFRGKGYGKKLLLKLVQTAKENNYGRVEWCVLNWNQTAIDFYKSLGAEPMEEWTTFRLSEKQIEALGN
jgi:GNAT superfamily N-acetyltransferase